MRPATVPLFFCRLSAPELDEEEKDPWRRPDVACSSAGITNRCPPETSKVRGGAFFCRRFLRPGRPVPATFNSGNRAKLEIRAGRIARPVGEGDEAFTERPLRGVATRANVDHFGERGARDRRCFVDIRSEGRATHGSSTCFERAIFFHARATKGGFIRL